MPSSLPDPWIHLPGGSKLYRHEWKPSRPPEACVLIVHGYAEHGGRYRRLAAELCNSDYLVTAYDQRGHGRTHGRRAYMHSHDDFVEDLIHVASGIRESGSELPLILFGHSMGGAIVILAAMERPEIADGIILSSPFLGSNQAQFLQKSAHVLGGLLPTLPTITLDRTLLSHDADYVADSQADLLNYHGRMPARTGSELLRAVSNIEKNGHTLDLPVLLLHGTADLLTDPGATCDFYNRLQSKDKTLALFDEMYHETFNEPQGSRVVDEIQEWIAEHWGESIEVELSPTV